MVNHFRRCRSWDFWDLVRETSYWEEIFVSHFSKLENFMVFFFLQKICWNQEKTVRNKPPFQIEVPGEKLIDSVYLEMICLPVMPVKSECSVRKPLQKIR